MSDDGDEGGLPAPYQLIGTDWEAVLHRALRRERSRVRIACPFIKRRALERLLAVAYPDAIEVVTRFDLDGFAAGASDLSALRVLLDEGGRVRGVRGLHAKLYLFGEREAVVTSANLTNAGLGSNHELGVAVRDPAAVRRCAVWFAGLWEHAGEDLAYDRLAAWEERVEACRLAGGRLLAPELLGDEGVRAPAWSDPSGPRADGAGDAQAFVKFFGTARRRAPRTIETLEELERSGSHWACTYPLGKRPRRVRDGDAMFVARLVAGPPDILVYGRATAMRHVEAHDDASEEEIALRPWKRDWPHYVRVHDGEYVRGPLGNGVSLSAMMDELGAESFATTSRNARRGEGNVEPRRAYGQQPDVRLTPRAQAWLDAALDAAIARHGALGARDLARLDRPPAPPQRT